MGESAFATNVLAEPLQTASGPVAAGSALIAYADLSLGAAVEEVLDRHLDASHGRLRGIRYSTAWEDDPAIRSHYPTRPGMLALDSVRDGIRTLGSKRLTFDVWAYFTQLADIAQAADACPQTKFILNHCGGPLGIGKWSGKRETVLSIWSEGMKSLAERDNIFVKIGGLGMPLAGFAFHKREVPPSSSELSAEWSPLIHRCIDLFGPERCMFESNWPVDRTAGRYGTIWNAFKKSAAHLNQSERTLLFSGTAKTIYRFRS